MLPRQVSGPALFGAAVLEAAAILLSASGIDGQGHLSPTYAATNQLSSGDSSPMFILGLLIHTSRNRLGSIVLPRQGAGTALLSDAANKGLGRVPHLLQMMRYEEKKGISPALMPPQCHERGVTCSVILMSCEQGQLYCAAQESCKDLLL